ncbi:MAG: hypothetical protein QOC60_1614, partial [Frankiaceae bacterium]|nr:hypothetical protein [Frankiaceae bacterium]
GFLMYGSTWRQCGTTVRWCGAWLSAGGTSSGAPVQAGLFASAMSTFGAHRPNVGSLHDVLYGNPAEVRDIVGGTGGRLLATRGYDLVTGLGVPVWSALLQRITEPAVELPAASASTTVPIRVVDLAAATISGYSVGENLTACPAAPDAVTAPTSLTLAAGPDRAAQVGVCVFHDGTTTFVSRVVKLDRTAPVAVPHLRISTSTSIQARWDANDAGGSGAISYNVTITRASDGVIVWQRLRELPYLSVRFAPGSAYTIRASATDAAGNVGPTVTSAVIPVPYDDAAAVAKGAWKRVTDAASYNHSYLRSATRGASLTRVVTGRSVSALVHTSADGGTLRAFVDGKLVRTISLFSASTHRDVTMPLASWSRVGQHTVALVVTGYRPPGSSGAMNRVDGIAVS